MARPVWSGALTFGLVTLPVGLYTATDSHTIRFHQLQRGTSDRVRNRRVNERTGEEVPLDDVVKGFDAGDEYVLVEREELDGIAPGRSKSLEVSGFVPVDRIEPVYFDRTYYLGPRGEGYEKVYALLVEALERSRKAAVATFVMRSHEYLVAVASENGVLALHTLHWADEVRDPREVVDPLPSAAGVSGITDRELRTAEQLIETLSIRWRPEDFHDTFREKVTELVAAKQAGEAVPKAEGPAEPTEVVDLMDVLKASVDRAKGGTRRAASGRRNGSGSGTGRAQPPGGLAELTKAELYRRAADAGVRGRSGMNREELVAALGGEDGAASRGRRRAAS
ncbi:Ku protein [Streptomyces sp. NPDC058045]|uniref:non-homologous end joining protein Ku n=1 Tax=Streptomyces sp. NPDC058045 TaxID=3346311 RepID=UPI0036E67A73